MDREPQIVRAALSWVEETPNGEHHRARGLAALDVILADLAEANRMLALGAADTTAADLAQDIEFMKAENARLREFYEARCAVEEGLGSFALHTEAVERLRQAEDAIYLASRPSEGSA